MSFEISMLIAVIILTASVLYGIPIPVAFAIPSVWMIVTMGGDPLMLLVASYGKVNSVVLLAIPFFIIAGGFLKYGKLGDVLIHWIETFFGHLKGGLYFAVTVASAVFGSVCGSGTATMACIGSILAPQLKERKYNPGLYAAVISCSGPLGILIPPSAIMILYAWCTDTSVLACFLSTIIPGIMLTTLMALVGVILERKSTEIVTLEKKSFVDYSKSIAKTTTKSIPAILMPVIILGGIYGGLMTPCESGAVAVVYSIFAGIFIYKAITFKSFCGIMVETTVTNGVIFMLIMYAAVLSRLFLQGGLPEMLVNLIHTMTDNPTTVLVILNVIMVIVGMITDDVCGVLICAPIMAPICTYYGIDLVHFAAILGVNIGMGNVTPPCAPYTYLASRITGVPVIKIFKYSFILILFAYLPVLIITTYVPEVATWLPQLILGDKLI